MKIKVIDFGYEKLPFRAHDNDAGADVHVCFHNKERHVLAPHETLKVPLGLGLCLPDGYAAYVFPRRHLCKTEHSDADYDDHAYTDAGRWKLCDNDGSGMQAVGCTTLCGSWRAGSGRKTESVAGNRIACVSKACETDTGRSRRCKNAFL